MPERSVVISYLISLDTFFWYYLTYFDEIRKIITSEHDNILLLTKSQLTFGNDMVQFEPLQWLVVIGVGFEREIRIVACHASRYSSN